MADTDIIPQQNNANMGTLEGTNLLRYSLEHYGAGRSILLDANGQTIAGSQTLQMAVELGIPVEVVKSDGSTLIAVQRDDLDLDRDPEATELAYLDNRVGEKNLKWNLNQILEDKKKGLKLERLFSNQEIQAMMIEHGFTVQVQDPDQGGSASSPDTGVKLELLYECPDCGCPVDIKKAKRVNP